MPGSLRLQRGVGWIGSLGHQFFGIRGWERSAGTETLLKEMGLQSVFLPEITSVDASFLRFDRMLVARVRTDAFAVTWARERQRARERLLAIFVRSGVVRLHFRGGHAEREVHTFGLIPPGEVPVSIRTNGPADVLFFSFDRGDVPGRIPLGLTVQDTKNLDPLLMHIYAYLAALLEERSASKTYAHEPLSVLTVQMARSLVAITVGDWGSKVDIFSRAQSIIELNFHRHDLAPQSLAENLGIPRRTLERIFQTHGVTVAASIRLARARAARQMLDRFPNMSTTDVAAVTGFSTRTSMNRAISSLSL